MLKALDLGKSVYTLEIRSSAGVAWVKLVVE
jgi:hypothetical protein